jgi:hypothetical protein
MGMFELFGAVTSGSSFLSNAGVARQALAGVIVSEPTAPTSTDYVSAFSRGMFRGIDRGTA